jgi:hypothetical protein
MYNVSLGLLVNLAIGTVWTLWFTKFGLALVDYHRHRSLWIWSDSFTAVFVGHDDFRTGLVR